MEIKRNNMKSINFKKYEMMPLTIEKLKDTKFDGKHPNEFNVGFKITNTVIDIKQSIINGCLFVDYEEDKWFHTSEIKKQEEYEGYDLLYTLNSIYKVTPNFISIPGVQEKHSLTVK
jgi:hypothetical protein